MTDRVLIVDDNPANLKLARLVLERNAGNKRQACRALDISYHTLNAYLRYRPVTKAGTSSIVSKLVSQS